MTVYILFAILMGGYDKTTMVTTEFNNREACLVAANHIIRSRVGRDGNGGERRKNDIIFCSKKG